MLKQIASKPKTGAVRHYSAVIELQNLEVNKNAATPPLQYR